MQVERKVWNNAKAFVGSASMVVMVDVRLK